MTERAFILKIVRYSEADLIITALNSQGAKVKWVARNVAKSRRRFGGGVLEPLHLVTALVSTRESQGLRTVSEASIVEGFDAIRNSYLKIEAGLAILKLVDMFAVEGVTDSQPLFDLLGHSLRQLSEAGEPKTVLTHFTARLLFYVGLLADQAEYHPFLQVPMAAHDKLAGEGFDWERLLAQFNYIIKNQ